MSAVRYKFKITDYALHMYPNTFLSLPVSMPDQEAPGNIQ